MLALSRKPGQKILVGGGITIVVLEIQGNRVRLGVEAPADVGILRAELEPRSPQTGLAEGDEAALQGWPLRG